MSRPSFRRALRQALSWGLATLLLFVLPAAAGAQVKPDSVRRDTVQAPSAVPAPADSAKAAAEADSVMQARILARSDSVRRAMLADTLRMPVARFEVPAILESTDRLRWTREQLLSSGAVNLADLLDRVPGITTYRSGWIAGVHAAVFQGDAKRIRYFLDGIELDAIEARNGGTLDLTDIQLWTLDEIVIERPAGEVRVWMRTASVVKTIPYTRVDIFTGDLNTNAFRGQFARRWRNGVMLQMGGQQIATQTGRVSAFGGTGSSSARQRSDGTVKGYMIRTGWAGGRWSADLYGNATSRDRDGHTPRKGFDTLPDFKGGRRDGYARVGYGDTSGGFWSQALVGATQTRVEPRISTESSGGAASLPSPDDSTEAAPLDTTTGRTQQVVAVGYRAARWSASYTNRMRLIDGDRVQAPVFRASATLWKLDLSAVRERRGADSTDRRDLLLRLRPVQWITLMASRSDRDPADTTGRPANRTMRAEAAVRLKRLWLGAGVLQDQSSGYDNLTLIKTPLAGLTAAAATGALVSASGRIYKDLSLDVQAIRWDAAQYNRPQTHARVELALVSDWRRRFPKGEFSINTRLSYDYRSGVPFFYGNPDNKVDLRVTEPAQVATAVLEIRIQRATLFYQYRNLSGGAYEQIRGITMPPAVQMYGVRWDFWN